VNVHAPVPPAPVIRATPASFPMIEAMVVRWSTFKAALEDFTVVRHALQELPTSLRLVRRRNSNVISTRQWFPAWYLELQLCLGVQIWSKLIASATLIGRPTEGKCVGVGVMTHRNLSQLQHLHNNMLRHRRTLCTDSLTYAITAPGVSNVQNI
jgi:hypothetical protein